VRWAAAAGVRVIGSVRTTAGPSFTTSVPPLTGSVTLSPTWRSTFPAEDAVRVRCSVASGFARVMPPISRTGIQYSVKRMDSCGARKA
jgi:hypothetical protein